MKLYRLLSLAVILTTLSGCNNNSSIARVILLAGQSNMEGHDSPWSLLPNEIITQYRSNHDNVKINYDCTYEASYESGVANTSNGQFVYVDFGQGRNTTLFGPEVGIASYLGAHDPNHKYYLVKSCEGSSSLAEQWAEDGRCYQTFIKDVNDSIATLKKQNLNVRIVGFMWMQGEHDADTIEHANKYKDRTFGLVNRINTAFKDYLPSYGVPFIDAGISTDGMWQFADTINLAKREVVNSNSHYRYVSDSETLDKQPPNRYHYTPRSYLRLGEKFAEQYLSIK